MSVLNNISSFLYCPLILHLSSFWQCLPFFLTFFLSAPFLPLPPWLPVCIPIYLVDPRSVSCGRLGQTLVPIAPLTPSPSPSRTLCSTLRRETVPLCEFPHRGVSPKTSSRVNCKSPISFPTRARKESSVCWIDFDEQPTDHLAHRHTQTVFHFFTAQ